MINENKLPSTSAHIINLSDSMSVSSFLFCSFSQNTVWKGQNGWGLEEEEVGLWHARGTVQWEKARETCAPLGGAKNEEGTGANNCSPCKEKVEHH